MFASPFKALRNIIKAQVQYIPAKKGFGNLFSAI